MSAETIRGHEPHNEILTVEEVAAYLRLQPQTIYKWAQERRIPAAKLGKEWRFRKSLIDRWLDDQIVWPDGSTSRPGAAASPTPSSRSD